MLPQLLQYIFTSQSSLLAILLPTGLALVLRAAYVIPQLPYLHLGGVTPDFGSKSPLVHLSIRALLK